MGARIQQDRGVKDTWRRPTRSNNLVQWKLTETGLQSQSMQRLYLGPLHICSKCAAWFSCGVGVVFQAIFFYHWIHLPNRLDCLFELHWEKICIVLLHTDVSRGAVPNRELYSLWVKGDGTMGRGICKGERWGERELWSGCKLNKL